MPVIINGQQQIYVDLRDGLSHVLLAGSPWESVPWEKDEQKIMRRLRGPGYKIFHVLGEQLVPRRLRSLQPACGAGRIRASPE